MCKTDCASYSLTQWQFWQLTLKWLSGACAQDKNKLSLSRVFIQSCDSRKIHCLTSKFHVKSPLKNRYHNYRFATRLYIYMCVCVCVKESKGTHRFSVTLSFAPKRSSESSVWRALRRETQSNRESTCPLWFFHFYIPISATTASSTLCQGTLYSTFIYLYIEMYRWKKLLEIN